MLVGPAQNGAAIGSMSVTVNGSTLPSGRCNIRYSPPIVQYEPSGHANAYCTNVVSSIVQDVPSVCMSCGESPLGWINASANAELPADMKVIVPASGGAGTFVHA